MLFEDILRFNSLMKDSIKIVHQQILRIIILDLLNYKHYRICYFFLLEIFKA